MILQLKSDGDFYFLFYFNIIIDKFLYPLNFGIQKKNKKQKAERFNKWICKNGQMIQKSNTRPTKHNKKIKPTKS